MTEEKQKPEKQRSKNSPITAVMISVGLAFVGLAIAFYAINNLNLRLGQETPAPQPTGNEQIVGDPAQVVTDFYSWYLAYDGNPLTDEAYKDRPELCDDYEQQIEETLASFDNGGFDPFLCAQDVPEEFAVGNAQIDGVKASVDLEQSFITGKRLIPIELEKREEDWVITNVDCAEAQAQQGLGEEQTIVVYYPNEQRKPEDVTDCSLVYGTERTIDSSANIFEKKLNELFKGPTEEEQDQGYSSFFSAETEDILQQVVVEDNIAYVDLSDIRDIIPSANSSCGSQQFIASVEETIKHDNRNIEKVIIAINGNPETFYEWMQIGCTEENNNCDPGPLAE
jgi:spore germination protein GerM